MREFFASHFFLKLFMCAAAILTLHLFAPNAGAAGLQLTKGESWVVVASRQDIQEATDLARSYGRQVESVRVVRSINGWFAVVLGPIAALSIDEARAEFAPRLVLPNDAYLSQGDRYLETVFMTMPPTASELQLTGSDNWVVVASRQDQQEALDVARSYGQQGSGVRVVRSKNGWFAVVLGPISVSSIEEARAKYAPRLIIPSDAYLSRGERYVATVFVAPAAVGGASSPPSPSPTPSSPQASNKSSAIAPDPIMSPRT